ncbi:MAG: hypothetical protein NVS4B13_00290 [Candidatus Elarobacter sp.]
MATAQPITISTTGPFPASPSPAANPPNPQAVEITLNPLPPPGTKLTFQLAVTDNLNQTATSTATVTIQGAPSVTITPPTQAAGKTPFTLAAQASSPGGTIQQYTWTLTNVVAPPVGTGGPPIGRPGPPIDPLGPPIGPSGLPGAPGGVGVPTTTPSVRPASPP